MPGGTNAGSPPSSGSQPGSGSSAGSSGGSTGGSGSTTGSGSGSGTSAGSGSGSGGSGTGSGTTQAGWSESKSSLGFAGQMRAADFNGDGHQDLLVFRSGLDVLLNNGSGTFSAPATSALPSGAIAIVQVAIADLNGDGFTDVAACAVGNGASGSAAVYLNDHSGKLILGQVIALPAACKGIAAGDANRDGKADLAIAYYTGSFTAPTSQIATWFGDGTGHFANPANQTVTLTFSQEADRNPCSITTTAGADFDGDSTLDLLVFGLCQQGSSATTGNIYFAHGDGTGHYVLTKLTEAYTGASPSSSPYVKDINGDGKLDVVYLQEVTGPHGSDGTDLDYAINNGVSFTLIKTVSESAYAGNGVDIRTGSPLNGVGTAIEGFDMESASDLPASYGVKLFSDVNSSPAQTWIYGSANYTAPGHVTGIASADFDGNGLQDFAVTEEDSNHVATLHVYLNH
ncbi:MAG TPA: VCBS repeat-containing protein [Acidobacteriaceae bacterium]|nr:VCBS repeat-containing protein [Acidobacteriaceae bacterium]